ncbi:uncharacterized protein PAC_04918 [Phialocephala subalpina]|uniref:Cyanovirin-N domain-containing protein n=1 Tax=Phialocephala subalpina TaxID=576137 RepID=A0A1L7WQJ3_9HELO|nr:uncharacterized protein PAC_04918 [Phialocephala subalpina]
MPVTPSFLANKEKSVRSAFLRSWIWERLVLKIWWWLCKVVFFPSFVLRALGIRSEREGDHGVHHNEVSALDVDAIDGFVYGVAHKNQATYQYLCTNKAFYDYGTIVGLVCWTHGTKIENDRTWLQTTDACYVTQDDLEAYNGTCELSFNREDPKQSAKLIDGCADEADLSYCGKDSEDIHLTLDLAVVKYDTECNLCLDVMDCITLKYLSPDTELIVTCWTDQGEAIAGDKTWLKTSDNCYVAEVGLYEPANKDILDNCGPIGFLQVNWTGSKRDTSRSPKPITLPSLQTPPPPKIGTDLKSHYLANITVGEDNAFCHSCANSTCDVVKKYPYKYEVWVQCYVDNLDATNPNETYWYETTDFCYVHEGDFEQSLFDLLGVESKHAGAEVKAYHINLMAQGGDKREEITM